MDTLQNVILLLQQGDFMTALDLRDAYFHIPFHPAHLRYLCFVVSGKHYRFKSAASRVFAKCLAVVAAHMRQWGIHVFSYLDDWLIKSTTQQQCLPDMQATINLLHDLGFTISATKSHLQPLQIQSYLGAVFNTVVSKALPSPARVQSFQVFAPSF